MNAERAVKWARRQPCRACHVVASAPGITDPVAAFANELDDGYQCRTLPNKANSRSKRPPLPEDAPFLPARMVNEYVYCPRLAYLEC